MSTSMRLGFCGLVATMLVSSVAANADRPMALRDSKGAWKMTINPDTSRVWSPNGRYRLSACYNNGKAAINVFDNQTKRFHMIKNGGAVPLAWREDSGVFASLNHGNYDQKSLRWIAPNDGQMIRELKLPSFIRSVRDMRWIPGTDNLALLAETGNGNDVYITDSNALIPVTHTHDIRGITIAETSGYEGRVIWARGTSPYQFQTVNVYAFNPNDRTMALQRSNVQASTLF